MSVSGSTRAMKPTLSEYGMVPRKDCAKPAYRGNSAMRTSRLWYGPKGRV